MRKKSVRLFLPVDDFDDSLIRIRMDKSLNVIDPTEIVGGNLHTINQLVRDEHRNVLLRSLDR